MTSGTIVAHYHVGYCSTCGRWHEIKTSGCPTHAFPMPPLPSTISVNLNVAEQLFFDLARELGYDLTTLKKRRT